MDGPGISRALERMAHGIVARFPGEPLAIVGLLSQGDVIARRLVDKVKELGVEAQYGAIDISLYRDDIFKLEARPSLRSSNLPFSTDDMRVVLVDDVLYHKDMECTVAKNKVLWTIIPLKIIFDYVKSESVKAEAKALIKAGKVCHSYYYEGDRSLKRWVHYKKNQFHYFEKYKRYFGNKGLRD